MAEDHPLTREGLALAARVALPGASIATAGSIGEAIEAAQRSPPDRMILLDYQLPDTRGFSGLMAMQHRLPGVPIVIVTGHDDPKLVEAARALGAAGFLSKTLPLDEIAGRLRRIDQGERLFPETGSAREAGGNVASIAARIGELSRAQHAVLMALADGRSNKAIAYDLAITEATVKAHMTAIFRKLGVSNRAQALVMVQPLLGDIVAVEGV